MYYWLIPEYSLTGNWTEYFLTGNLDCTSHSWRRIFYHVYLYWPFDFTCMCNWMMINILSKSLVCWFIKIFGLWTDLLMLTYLQHVKPLNYCNIYTWNRPVHLLEYYCYTWNRPVHLVKYTGSSIPAFLLALSIEEAYQCITCITLIHTGVLHV